MPRVIECACEKCGTVTGIYAGQQVFHWVCKKRGKGAPPRYRPIEDVEVTSNGNR